MKINEETTVSKEQVLFNKLRYEDQELIIKIMKTLQPCELSCEIEEKKIPEKLDIENDGYTITLFGKNANEWTILNNVDVLICDKINEIIDYLKSKGDE